ncbi:MAG: hypothetical protein AB7K36_03515 [Chloroflexota bacterium]
MTATLERSQPDDSERLAPSHVAGRTRPGAARRTRFLAVAAGLTILACAGWLIAGQIDKPFVYDDVSFMLGARAVAETGRPFGNQGYLLHLYTEREQWALWHPPLYIYLLGLTVALVGSGERAAHGLSVLCLLISAGLTFDLARRVTLLRGGSPDRGLAAGVLAMAVYLLNPLAIQSALLLDIDNTILMVLITGFCWLTVRLPGVWGLLTIGGLAALYAVTLWAKLTTPIALAAALLFTRLFQPVGWRGAAQAFCVVALGWAIFAVSWVGISALAGFPLDYTLDVVRNEALESGASSAYRLETLERFLWGVAPALLWIGPFFCLLFVAAGLPRLWGLARGKGLDAGDVLVVLGAAIYLAYIFKLAGDFPKYHASMLPLWAAASGVLVARAAGRPTLAQYGAATAGYLLLLWWFWGSMANTWAIRWEPALNLDLIVVPLVIGLGIAVAWAALGRRSLLGALPVALLVLTLSWSVSLAAAQRDQVGSSTYYYGRHGQRAAAAAVNALLRPDEVYVASKDVAWYVQNPHYVDQDTWQYVVWELHDAHFDGTYLGFPVRILALAVDEPSLRTAYDGLLLAHGYQHAGQYGSYLIYARP